MVLKVINAGFYERTIVINSYIYIIVQHFLFTFVWFCIALIMAFNLASYQADGILLSTSSIYNSILLNYNSCMFVRC